MIAFQTREVGSFRVKGKLKPIVIYELLCRIEEADEKLKKVCELFAEALSDFRTQSWDQAIEKFKQCIEKLDKDGPSLFYIGLCEQYKGKSHLKNRGPGWSTWKKSESMWKKQAL